MSDRGCAGTGCYRALCVLALALTIILGWPRAALAADWYVDQRTPELLAMLVCAGVVLIFVLVARKRGRPFAIRPLAGLAAVDDALGRATELGAPVVYVTGWGGDLARPTTMASLAILSHVAERAALLNTRVLFPAHDPLVASAAQDTIQQAYARAGRPDLYRPGDAAFVTQSQLGYAAAVEGVLSRNKPGAVFLLGTFEGEALILAETAHNVGAVQISGTDSTIQLSFFLVACDYTLIGEELFAASAYLSQDVSMLGALRGQDVLKLIIVALLLAGFALGAAGIVQVADWLK